MKKGAIRIVVVSMIILGIMLSACEYEATTGVDGVDDLNATDMAMDSENGIVQLELAVMGKCYGPLYKFTTNFNLTHQDIAVKQITATADEVRTRTMADVLSGKGPDLLLVSRDDMERLYAYGAILPAEELISKETAGILLKGVLDYGSVEGKLVGVPPYIQGMQSFVARRDVISKDNFTLERLMELKKTRKDVRRILTYPREEMDIYYEFYALVGADLQHSKFLDWGNGISAFEKNGFTEVLELLKEESEAHVGGEALVTSGEVLAEFSGANEPWQIFRAYSMYGNNGWLVGFPTEKGGKNYFQTDGLMVVNQNSPHKKEISEFFEFILSLDNQRSSTDFLSVRPDVAEHSLVFTEERDREGNVKGETWAWAIESDRGHETMFLSVTGSKEELVAVYESVMQSLIADDRSEVEAVNIIWDEIEPYLEGKKNAQATVESIDRRIQLYFDER